MSRPISSSSVRVDGKRRCNAPPEAMLRVPSLLKCRWPPRPRPGLREAVDEVDASVRRDVSVRRPSRPQRAFAEPPALARAPASRQRCCGPAHGNGRPAPDGDRFARKSSAPLSSPDPSDSSPDAVTRVTAASGIGCSADLAHCLEPSHHRHRHVQQEASTGYFEIRSVPRGRCRKDGIEALSLESVTKERANASVVVSDETVGGRSLSQTIAGARQRGEEHVPRRQATPVSSRSA